MSRKKIAIAIGESYDRLRARGRRTGSGTERGTLRKGHNDSTTQPSNQD